MNAAVLSADEVPHRAEWRRVVPLTGGQLVTLQLCACGYTPAQIAVLSLRAHSDVLADLHAAATALGVLTAREAAR